jgi:hypothetical protein
MTAEGAIHKPTSQLRFVKSTKRRSADTIGDVLIKPLQFRISLIASLVAIAVFAVVAKLMECTG